MSTVINEDICIRQGAQYLREMKRIRARYMFKALVAGTSDSSVPTWPTITDQTVTDGGVTWVNEGEWDEAAYPDVDIWLASTAYAKRARVVTPIEAVDLTNYTGAFQIRDTVTATTTIHTGVVTFGSPRTNGEFVMEIPTTTTEAFTFDTAVYDLELSTAAGEVDFVIRGNVQYLVKEVTR